MAEEPNGWLRELLQNIQRDITHVREKVDGFDERITRLETAQAQRTRGRWNAPHWVLVGVTAVSLLWSIAWTAIH